MQGIGGPAEDVTLRNNVTVIWLVMISYEPWARQIYIKMNATEAESEGEPERMNSEGLESCHPDLVFPNRWPLRHTSSWCVWLSASHTRGHVNICCIYLYLLLFSSLRPSLFQSFNWLNPTWSRSLCCIPLKPRRGWGINIKRKGTERIISDDNQRY